MNLIITLIAIIFISYFFTWLSKKLNVFSVIGLITAGLVLGSPLIKNFLLEPNTNIISIMGDIGLLCLMFLAGLESSWANLSKEKKDALLIAIFACITPFLLGFLTFLLLGYSYGVAAIVGVCMCITAEATKARVLLELKKLKTKIGSAMMEAGIIDDVMGLLLFVIITILVKQPNLEEDFLVIGAIVAFFFGTFIEKEMIHKNKILKYIKEGLLFLVVPFFFISIGLKFDFKSLILSPLPLLVMLIIAISGKLIGTFLIRPFTKFKWKQLWLIGWGMNSRGALELALAVIAFRSNLIPSEIYSSLIIMALVTTITFPFVIKPLIKKNPRIMN